MLTECSRIWSLRWICLEKVSLPKFSVTHCAYPSLFC